MSKTKARLDALIESMLTRKFIVAVVSSVLVACSYIFDLGLTEAQIALILAPLATWIVAEGTADVVSRAKTTTISTTTTNGSPAPLETVNPPISGEIWTGAAQIKTADEKTDE